MQRDSKTARFGRVYPIGREDYTREVTEASMANEDDDTKELGTGVVCFLYKDGWVHLYSCVRSIYCRPETHTLFSIPHSDRTFEHIRALATRHPRTKFVSIVGDKCIPNLPDTRIPMVIVYRKGDIRNQVVAWGADRERRVEGIAIYHLKSINNAHWMNRTGSIVDGLWSC